ncbi:MaoC family dehydratase N-terminal domain-containing protein [Actinomadura sp. NEAU-AAG7]|uniref:FAS1-like dehydratase domain-containing protein n=1 Tax=Actinomadura sp. NEAU-AAG7 TaxID=2839640 RepID=UPI001BE4BF66|nr:MaoC family dehydratase N-terminal domain-containing protein [Actinomadura sp. NEAU-AAG7]MBT2207908.1 MaoC family dehydratase [Actinomadura sp. NEAU-AAG7]
MSTLDEVYRRVRAQVGTSRHDDLGRVSARDFQRFAVAAGETDPVYFDDASARAAGLPGAVAPPLFPTSVLGWDAGPPQDALRPDGTTDDEMAELPLAGLRMMGAGQDIDFHAPVRDGTHIVRETSIEDVALKEGRSGPFLVVTLLRAYRDASGAPLATSRENLIARPEAEL